MTRRSREREHPLLIAYGHYLERVKEFGYATGLNYMGGGRSILAALRQAGYQIPDGLDRSHFELRQLCDRSHGFARLIGTRLKQAGVSTADVNRFETFLAQGFPLAQRWHGDATRTVRQALAYLDSSHWRLHVVPLVRESSGTLRLLTPRTSEQREAIAYLNEVGRCVDCGQRMEKGVVRERQHNRRTGDRSLYMAVSCGETGEHNRCHRGWRASEAKLDIEDSLLRYNPDFVPTGQSGG